MGARMKEDDIYIGTFLDLFNVRFAPTHFMCTAASSRWPRYKRSSISLGQTGHSPTARPS